MKTKDSTLLTPKPSTGHEPKLFHTVTACLSLIPVLLGFPSGRLQRGFLSKVVYIFSCFPNQST